MSVFNVEIREITKTKQTVVVSGIETHPINAIICSKSEDHAIIKTKRSIFPDRELYNVHISKIVIPLKESMIDPVCIMKNTHKDVQTVTVSGIEVRPVESIILFEFGDCITIRTRHTTHSSGKMYKVHISNIVKLV